ncbi:NAD-dependent protein deacylase [Halobacillus campisalis]|uniref:protein acetyllysine N-acetyltransferase n=1 Tax=Halobacillus campisalis TaxID=435909 RepID=A0ABW2K3T4_9BACI|nr:NAD-dependent protein deacylase [Halobacillus campisalis]
MSEKLVAAARQIDEAASIVILTGAGVSTASGIPDFRSSKGVWTYDRRREDYMSSEYFAYDPMDFWKKYKEIFRIKLLQEYHPNPVHHFIKNLETEHRDVNIITQNVDGLHAAAHSRRVVEYHGSLDKASCPSCGKVFTIDYVLEHETPECDACHTIIKPNVVLFGDLITAHDEAEAIIDQADFLMVLGTSLQVTPFSLLPEYAVSRGIPSLLINKEPTIKDYLFDEVITKDLKTVIPQLEQYLKNVSSSE